MDEHHRARRAKLDPIRILIVDDEPQVLRALLRLLTRRGFEVTLAGSGDEALKQLEGARPHLVLSDYRMPVMSGLTLLEEVRRRWPEVALVVMSGHADEAAVLEALAGRRIDLYLHKPWNHETLSDELRAVVRPR